jgi:hypothetical protein
VSTDVSEEHVASISRAEETSMEGRGKQLCLPTTCTLKYLLGLFSGHADWVDVPEGSALLNHGGKYIIYMTAIFFKKNVLAYQRDMQTPGSTCKCNITKQMDSQGICCVNL